MNIITENMTPQRAQQLLDTQMNNRRPSKEMIDEMVSDIVSGSFDKEQAHICIAADGKLYYGQHILYAIVKFGSTVEILVATLEKDEHHHRGALNEHSKYRYPMQSFDFKEAIKKYGVITKHGRKFPNDTTAKYNKRHNR